MAAGPTITLTSPTLTLAAAGRQLRARTAEFVHDIERVWDVQFPPGRNPDLIFMAHLWEPLRVLPKPLALPLASEAAGLVCHALLAALGFRRKRSQARPRACRAQAPGHRTSQHASRDA